MIYTFAPRSQLHQFSDETQNLLASGTYQRPLPSETYFLPHASTRFSASDVSYQGGIRSQGMDAQSYLESISKMRGYVAPQRMKGEYKDNDKSCSALNVPSVPLSSLRGLR